MKHAGFWRQFIAVIVDQLAIMLPSTVVSEVYYYVAVARGVDTALAQSYSSAMIAGLVVLFSLSYYILLNGRYGMTLGRRLLNMKLVLLDRPNSDGIGYGRAAVRYLFFIVAGGFVRVAAFPSVPAALGVLIDAAAGATILWLLIDVSRRTLQDKIMGTVMIHDPQAKFPDFDPDKLPLAKIRLFSFTALVVINAFASVYIALNR
jgi:uncharacterized RDD family membrane protein YckC